jgi:hypothetical protein
MKASLESLAKPVDSRRKEREEKQGSPLQGYVVSIDRRKGAHHV